MSLIFYVLFWEGIHLIYLYLNFHLKWWSTASQVWLFLNLPLLSLPPVITGLFLLLGWVSSFAPVVSVCTVSCTWGESEKVLTSSCVSYEIKPLFCWEISYLVACRLALQKLWESWCDESTGSTLSDLFTSCSKVIATSCLSKTLIDFIEWHYHFFY